MGDATYVAALKAEATNQRRSRHTFFTDAEFPGRLRSKCGIRDIPEGQFENDPDALLCPGCGA